MADAGYKLSEHDDLAFDSFVGSSAHWTQRYCHQVLALVQRAEDQYDAESAPGPGEP
jgi:hypothetical protein